jgi:hypothetical protein
MRRGSLVHTGRQSRAQRQSVVVQRRPMAGDDEQAWSVEWCGLGCLRLEAPGGHTDVPSSFSRPEAAARSG